MTGVPPELTIKTAEAAFADTTNGIAKENGEPLDTIKLPEEIKFDKAVYGGISYFGQAATGVVLTNWLKHGGGRKHFVNIAEWLGPNFMKFVSKKKGKEAIDEATGTIIVSTMIMVGNAFLLPVKWLENRKASIIRNMTEKSNAKREARGEIISDEERAHQKARLDYLDHSPPQDWWSLGLGRAFALGAVYATLWGIGNKNNERMESGTYNAVKSTLESAGLKEVAHSKTLENYTRIAFYDMFYSMVSAGGLYVYSHFLHPFKQKDPAQAVLPPMEEVVIDEVTKDLPKPKYPKAKFATPAANNAPAEPAKAAAQPPALAVPKTTVAQVSGVTHPEKPSAELMA